MKSQFEILVGDFFNDCMMTGYLYTAEPIDISEFKMFDENTGVIWCCNVTDIEYHPIIKKILDSEVEYTCEWMVIVL